MLISDYRGFVRETNLSEVQNGFDIALYGLAGEVGSLVAALKKKLLAAGRSDWNTPNDEIIEELGDCFWYLFALGEAAEAGDFIAADVEGLAVEIGSADERAERLRAILGKKATDFLAGVPVFLGACEAARATLEDYQRLAFLTRRTHEDQLAEVCIAVLQQLTAQLFRDKLPLSERELNTEVVDQPIGKVLGHVAWHLSALASLYKLSLSDVAARNQRKLERRFGRGEPPPLPDRDAPPGEQLPRRFDVVFVSVEPGRSRMYLDGRRLGDDLTDNAHAEDGYRFHDVMHLALAAKLGWSPVLRKLMGRKRRSNPRTDEVEDGARAQIVEEAVIKAIHAEGVRLAELAAPAGRSRARLFANGADISFAFLKRLEQFVAGLEVEGSRYREWEGAIVAGFAIFEQLRSNGRGTVRVDLDAGKIDYVSDVFIDLHGAVAALGLGTADAADAGDIRDPYEAALANDKGAGEVLARRRAVAQALDLPPTSPEVCLVGWRGDVADVRLTGGAQAQAWARRIVMFRISTRREGERTFATALGIADK
jgi:NTP pyrophosphatase (non-canonical NTP hydrolase)